MSLARLTRRLPRALVVLAACGAAQAHDDEAAAAARLPQRVALLARAQSELERGDADQALDDFERAAMMLHAADAELGLIRAAMQDGQYRRALAFCAHTAGEHTDSADGGALYAWLLRIGGQGGLSARVLAQTRAQSPGDPLIPAVDRALGASLPVAAGTLLQPRYRMAPWPVMANAQLPVPATARFAGNAVLVDDGGAALVPLSEIAAASDGQVWVRNGLGQTTAAKLDRTVAALESRGLARLELQAPLSVGSSRQSAGRAPFAGSPGYSVQFGGGSEPAWPTLAQGFLGNPVGETGVRRLGFESMPGAPVFDAQGVLVGITLDTTSGQAGWVPTASWAAPQQAADHAAGAGQATRGPALVAPDEIYEAGLRRALQVLVDGAR